MFTNCISAVKRRPFFLFQNIWEIRAEGGVCLFLQTVSSFQNGFCRIVRNVRHFAYLPEA